MTWTLFEGDCFDYLPSIGDKSVDMVLCDLPYGTTRNKWDSVLDLDNLWGQYLRVIKDNGAIILTAQPPFDKFLGCSNINMLRYEWIWVKEAGTGFLNSKRMPLKIHENILVFYKTLPSYNPQMKSGGRYKSTYSHNNLCSNNYGEAKECFPVTKEYNGRFPTTILPFHRDRNRLHPTQKPVALFEYLIETYTNHGDTVLDNCAGSGTTGVACENTGRHSILMEKEPEYCQIIKQRLNEVTQQTRLPIEVVAK